MQVLSPCKTFGGPISVTELNELLRKNLNPQNNQAFCKYGSKVFRVGDRVMQILNAEGISNGEIGYILDACRNEKERSVTVSFPDGRTRTYLEENLSMLQLAYAMTIHKSLGSEYTTVILPVISDYSFILSRKMLYTAMTRAAKKVILIGTEKAVHTAIDSTDKDEWYTSLGEMIQNACKRWEHPQTLMEQLKISS